MEDPAKYLPQRIKEKINLTSMKSHSVLSTQQLDDNQKSTPLPMDVDALKLSHTSSGAHHPYRVDSN